LNTTAGPLNLGGWYLSDDATNLTKYQIPLNTIIGPSAYLVFDGPTQLAAAFVLSEQGGQVHLASPDATGAIAGYHESIRYGTAEMGQSIGRHVRSDGMTVDYVAQSRETLGGANAGPQVGPVVVNEIMYHPIVASTLSCAISPTSR
jgi:hypothetical protein